MNKSQYINTYIICKILKSTKKEKKIIAGFNNQKVRSDGTKNVLSNETLDRDILGSKQNKCKQTH